MELKIYINNSYFKTVQVEQTDSGGYNAVKIINQLHEDKANGLLSELEPLGAMKIKIVPVDK